MFGEKALYFSHKNGYFYDVLYGFYYISLLTAIIPCLKNYFLLIIQTWYIIVIFCNNVQFASINKMQKRLFYCVTKKNRRTYGRSCKFVIFACALYLTTEYYTVFA